MVKGTGRRTREQTVGRRRQYALSSRAAAGDGIPADDELTRDRPAQALHLSWIGTTRRCRRSPDFQVKRSHSAFPGREAQWQCGVRAPWSQWRGPCRTCTDFPALHRRRQCSRDRPPSHGGPVCSSGRSSLTPARGGAPRTGRGSPRSMLAATSRPRASWRSASMSTPPVPHVPDSSDAANTSAVRQRRPATMRAAAQMRSTSSDGRCTAPGSTTPQTIRPPRRIRRRMTACAARPQPNRPTS
jgi:hypothetical protein